MLHSPGVRGGLVPDLFGLLEVLSCRLLLVRMGRTRTCERIVPFDREEEKCSLEGASGQMGPMAPAQQFLILEVFLGYLLKLL